MVVHKRIAKAIKKRLPTKAKIYEQARKEDILPDLPGLDPVTRIGMMALVSAGVLNPRVAAVVAGYMLAENTERYWGDPLYGRFIPPVGPATEIDPSSPWMIPEGYSYYPPKQGRRKPVKAPTRKTSKANIAMKKAYAWLIKGHKGKMTQKKCRELLKKASRMASKANPGTKSRIGKTSRSKMLKECKRIRKQVWGTLKRK